MGYPVRWGFIHLRRSEEKGELVRRGCAQAHGRGTWWSDAMLTTRSPASVWPALRSCSARGRRAGLNSGRAGRLWEELGRK